MKETQPYEAECRRPPTDRERERDKEDVQATVAKQAGNGKAPKKNTTAIVSWSAYHGERQKRENRHNARVRCCLFFFKKI